MQRGTSQLIDLLAFRLSKSLCQGTASLCTSSLNRLGAAQGCESVFGANGLRVLSTWRSGHSTHFHESFSGGTYAQRHFATQSWLQGVPTGAKMRCVSLLSHSHMQATATPFSSSRGICVLAGKPSFPRQQLTSLSQTRLLTRPHAAGRSRLGLRAFSALQPKRTKFRKYQKGTPRGIRPNTTTLTFGKYGIKSLESGRIQGKTIEAVRRALARKLKRVGQIWVRIFPDIAVSQKPAEVRMGKGKGAPAFWVSRVEPGSILFELDGISLTLAKAAAAQAAHKLPVKTKFVEYS